MQWHQRLTRPWLLPAITLLALGTMTSLHLIPDFSREDPVLRIRVTQRGSSLPDGFYLYQQLNAHGISIRSITPEPDGLMIRLNDETQRPEAEDTLRVILSDAYSTL